MVASFVANDALIRGKRFSVAQTKAWVLTKTVGGDTMQPIVARGVAMPARLIDH